MNQPTPLRLSELWNTLRRYYLVVVIPTIGFVVLAGMYAKTRSKTWRASQTLTVREEAGGNVKGRFLDSESMQTAQETVLQVAKSPQVVAQALRQAGPVGKTSENWPSRTDVESLQSRIALTAPRGKEFGKTEIIYLSVKAPSADRAVDLTQAVGDQLVEHLKKIRVDRTKSVINELVRSRELAKTQLDDAVSSLAAIEAKVGPDLNELRNLNQSTSSSGHLANTRSQVEQAWRTAETRNLEALDDQKHLQAALKDPGYLHGSTPKRVLAAYPQIQRLSEGLADAQLAKSQLGGNMTDAHPKVQAAALAETKVRRELRGELANALSGLESEILNGKRRANRLKNQLEEVNQRLKSLSALRLPYENQEREVTKRTGFLEKIDNDLADARASQVAAKTISLLHRMDRPVGDDRPIGPGTATILAVGLIGGLATGIGLVFLVAPFGDSLSRRWSDHVGGRRASDQVRGRRAADELTPAPQVARGVQRRSGDKLPTTPESVPASPAPVASEPVAPEPVAPEPVAPSQSAPTPEPKATSVATVAEVTVTTSEQTTAQTKSEVAPQPRLEEEIAVEEELILTSSADMASSAATSANSETPSQPSASARPLSLVESLQRLAAKG